jgi:4-hydroxybenzoate polyprenyltransferase
LIISRANIQIASLPTAALGMILAARAWHDLCRLTVFLYVFIFFVILTFSCHLNCLSDLDVDKKYKTDLSGAVQAIGIPRLKIMLGLEAGVALAAIIVLWLLKGEAIYLLAVFGLAIGYAYSAPPLRIKKRGVLSPLPVMFGLYLLPILAGYYLMIERLSLFIFLFGIGYAMVMEGITVINTCEDYYEDETAGIRTLAHVAGIRNALFAGAALVFGGGAIGLGSFFIWKIVRRNLEPITTVTVLILSLLYLASFVHISRRLYLVSKSVDPAMTSKIYAKKMPLWFLMTRYLLLLMASALLFAF